MYSATLYIINAALLVLTVALLCYFKSLKRVLTPESSLLSQIGVGLLIWLGFIFVLVVINFLMHHILIRPFRFVFLPPKLIISFLLFQLLVAVMEELLFRGLLTELGRKLNLHWALIAFLSAALFGALHLISQPSFIQFVFPFVIGFVFSAVYQKSRHCSIYSIMLAHFLYDISIL
ncbi:MAG: CPBP family intramembrane metalloprotease [Oscillospiraceae bacterium]|nr:CPBP family intramembrane metalloprotease [Oscillospiraceae bacterium]